MTTEAKAVKIEWACPKCGAGANKHGRGGRDECTYRGDGCAGMVCECDEDTTATHGESFQDPCLHANCYHCGWFGAFPVKPKGLQGWERKALEAGWSPPEARRKELGL